MIPETMEIERMIPETMEFERMLPETMRGTPWKTKMNKIKELLPTIKIKNKKKAILLGGLIIPPVVAATATAAAVKAAHKYIKNKKRNDTKTTENI